jgi:hypothetical protein
MSQLGLTFFGLTSDIAPQVRASLFSQIHEIVFHGKGGYDWHTIYNMPIWLRRFTFNKIQGFYQDEKEAYENNSSGGGKQTVINSDGTIKTPELLQKAHPGKVTNPPLSKDFPTRGPVKYQ